MSLAQGISRKGDYYGLQQSRARCPQDILLIRKSKQSLGPGPDDGIQSPILPLPLRSWIFDTECDRARIGARCYNWNWTAVTALST